MDMDCGGGTATDTGGGQFRRGRERWDMKQKEGTMKRLLERGLRWFVWRLPRRVILWAAVRLFAAATCGEHRDVSVPDLTAMDALKAWGV